MVGDRRTADDGYVGTGCERATHGSRSVELSGHREPNRTAVDPGEDVDQSPVRPALFDRILRAVPQRHVDHVDRSTRDEPRVHLANLVDLHPEPLGRQTYPDVKIGSTFTTNAVDDRKEWTRAVLE